MFESALMKIELDNFVIHSKVDEFLLMKKSKSEDEILKQSEEQYNALLKSQNKKRYVVNTQE